MSKIPPELEAEMTPAIKAFVLALLDQVDRLTKQVGSLTDQVQKLTPRNSSMPPSTEHPHAKPKRKPTPGKKRKQGGQKGHKRHSRELIPAEQCCTVTPCHPSDCHPSGCRRCGGRRRGGDLLPDGAAPKRHQVWDLPPIKPIVEEYQLFRGHCACCGITTQVSLR